MAPPVIAIDPDNLLVMVKQIQSTANQFDSEMTRQVSEVQKLDNFTGAAATAYQTKMHSAGKQFKGVVASINDLADTLRQLGDGMRNADADLARIAGNAGSDIAL